MFEEFLDELGMPEEQREKLEAESMEKKWQLLCLSKDYMVVGMIIFYE